MKNDYAMPLILILLSSIILLSGWGTYHLLNKDSQSLLVPVERILEAVEDGNWDKTEESMTETAIVWKQVRKYWPMLIHHQEMDRIEESINKLKSYLKHKDNNQALAELYNLIYYIKHIPQKEAFNLQNIF